jgi:hypothetical protein
MRRCVHLHWPPWSSSFCTPNSSAAACVTYPRRTWRAAAFPIQWLISYSLLSRTHTYSPPLVRGLAVVPQPATKCLRRARLLLLPLPLSLPGGPLRPLALRYPTFLASCPLGSSVSLLSLVVRRLLPRLRLCTCALL